MSVSVILLGSAVYFCVKSKNRNVLPYQNHFKYKIKIFVSKSKSKKKTQGEAKRSEPK